MKRIIVYLSLLITGIIVSWCSNQNPIEHLNQQNRISWAINFQNWTFDRAPFSGERTWDEWNTWVTVTTTQDLGNGDFAQIHWLLLTSWTKLSYWGVSISKPGPEWENTTPRWYSSAYGEIFSWHDGHIFYYLDHNWNSDLVLSIYKLKKSQIPSIIYSWRCEQFDTWLENDTGSWMYFWYKPTKLYTETLERIQQRKTEQVDPDIYPCGFPNTFQVIWDYIVAGWFWWKNGWWERWWWLNTIEIVKQ